MRRRNDISNIAASNVTVHMGQLSVSRRRMKVPSDHPANYCMCPNFAKIMAKRNAQKLPLHSGLARSNGENLRVISTSSSTQSSILFADGLCSSNSISSTPQFRQAKLPQIFEQSQQLMMMFDKITNLLASQHEC